MNESDELSRQLSLLSQEESTETQHCVGSILRRVVHELNSPLGAIVMEIYSLEELAGKISTDAEQGSHESLAANLDEMKAILANLDGVRRSMSEVLDKLQGVGMRLTQEIEAVSGESR